MKRTLVISDIHGCYNEFLTVLTKVNYVPHEDKLIILGDMIDRGKQSKQVVEHILSLQKSHDVITIGGNHEDMFLKWFDEPFDKNHVYGINGGWKTIESYCKSHRVYGKTPKTKQVFRQFYTEHVSFFRTLVNYAEDEHYIYVHAGIDLKLGNWRDTPKEYARWARDDFWKQPNTSGKIIIFGHTPTSFLHQEEKIDSTDVWISDDAKICIDGGCSMGGQLHCLVIRNGNYEIFSVDKQN